MKNYSILTALAVAIVLGSCSRQDMSEEQRTLAVDVQMASSAGLTRAESSTISNVVALDDDLEIVTNAAPFEVTGEAPITRGTPITNASSLPSMGIGVYTNSTFTQTVTGTNSGGSWSLADNVAIDGGKNSYSYYAYSPAAAAATNGVTVSADSKSLTYVAPADITKQPDLCWAEPITGDKTGSPTFAMKHALTAVGLKVRADNVEIQSVTLTQINSSGTLNLTNGAWSSLGTPKDFVLPLSNSKPSTGDNAADLTTANGFLMVPAQDITADAKKLVIVYKYTGESIWRTGTHSLKSLGGTTPWAAGQQVIYTIQLKAKFSLTVDKTSDVVSPLAGNYTLNYTTSSSSSTTLDPRVTCPDASGGWITNLKVNRGNGSGTITFAYTQNGTGSSAARKTRFTVISGYTEKYVDFTQVGEVSINISSSSSVLWRLGGSYKIQVTTPMSVPWVVLSNSNCTVSPSSGSAGTTEVTITVPATTSSRSVSAVFATNLPGTTQRTATWSSTQSATPEGFYDRPISGSSTTFVYKTVATTDNMGYFTALWHCENASVGYKLRVASLSDLRDMYNNKASYGTFLNNYYWSETAANPPNHEGSKKIRHMGNGSEAESYALNTNCTYRCVKTF